MILLFKVMKWTNSWVVCLYLGFLQAVSEFHNHYLLGHNHLFSQERANLLILFLGKEIATLAEWPLSLHKPAEKEKSAFALQTTLTSLASFWAPATGSWDLGYHSNYLDYKG
jgi:hypothetical protein